ncbi:hypothetical protein [Aquabacterium sp. OR-4]|uniref:hypothetical protein n=1 Tax=Aquabacterium sp. OR-4 TaxID=2978127 RepID=UPI0021B46691|nr:hypothetical protein [Aquabacterium sp. OR-4]MDT7837088.1 hypothetical protein [Aquabacterium sp. OR-4]
MTSLSFLRTLLLAAGLAAAGVAAATPLVAGLTQVQGRLDGADLLSLDTAYAASAAATLSDGFGDIELLAPDFGLAVELSSDGVLRLIDFDGDGALAGGVLRLGFDALPTPLGAVLALDFSALAAGSLVASLIDAHSVQIAWQGVQLAAPFAELSWQLQSVPEPGALALLATAALAAAAARPRPGRRTRGQG